MMTKKALFAGLVVDEFDNPVDVAYVGEDPCYVVNDAGFRRHIPAGQVDRQVFQTMSDLVKGNEDTISEQAAKMLGQEDIFSLAMIANQLKNIYKQLDVLIETGIPEETRAYLGMMGFKVRINLHGDVIDIDQPGIIDPNSE
ncbi:MAG: hypothetical protein A2W33_04795 [Chloroflexi bacterium RBG_16_52_11]|nr:MAG: hypothetical protein A2W33_04795 [Chloroflexi bacterium RBG_16_52_11]